ncbi:MAG: hypothetical protein ASARMPREDX12_000214 [Alectoria sarmentosa]|nr:MAG: hypothetical protein ASARMPREDX12_000214 [Alectoria sarmentosa]
MTCARAFIGRGLANPPTYQPLPTGNEAAGIAYLLREAKAWELVTGTSIPNKPAHATPRYVQYICPEPKAQPSLYESGETVADPNPSNDLIMTAKSIGKTVPMEDSTLLLAQQLVNAIRATMTICSHRHMDGVLDGNFLDCNEHRWAIQPSLRMNNGNVDHLPTTTLYSSSSPGRVEMSKGAQEHRVLTADSGTMAAILSLWLAVLEHRYPLSKARARDENETARWPHYYRIIGDDRIITLLGNATGKWDLADQNLDLIGEPTADAVELDVLRLSDPSISSTRILRMLGQREFHPSVKDTEREENDFAYLRGLSLPEMQASLMRDFYKGTNNVTTEVAVLPSSSLERNCAQELFTLFILSFTSQILQVKGRTTKITGPNGETWTNDVLSEIASAVVLAGLAEDEAEALTLVVPAFAARGLLPTELS